LSGEHVALTDLPVLLDDGLLSGVSDPIILKLLSAVDGNSTIAQIAERAEMDPEHARACFGFLGSTGLVAFGRTIPTPVPHRKTPTSRPAAPTSRPPVMSASHPAMSLPATSAMSRPPTSTMRPAMSTMRPAARNENVPGGTETVLVVDDDGGVRRVLERFLRGLGYEVLLADGGPAALAAAAAYAGEIHILLTDVHMPGVSGPELAHALVRVRPRLKVLFATGDQRRLQLGSAEVHVTNVLQKPFSGPQVAVAVRALLDGKKPSSVPAPPPPKVLLDAGLDMNVLNDSASARVALDTEATILWLNRAWRTFPLNTRVREGTLALGIGSSYFDAVYMPVRGNYEEIFFRVLATGKPFEHSFERSSADMFRMYHVRISSIGGRGLLLEHRILGEHRHERVAAAPADAMLRTAPVVLMCCYCRRVARSATGSWEWLPDWVRSPPGQVSDGICTSCRRRYWPD
jgi:CheY-like chemotaxis protein